MAKDGISIIIQSLREETRETLEKSLFPLNRSEFICDLCGFENEVDEEKKIVVECQGCHETILGGLPNNGDHRKSFRFFFLKLFNLFSYNSKLDHYLV